MKKLQKNILLFMILQSFGAIFIGLFFLYFMTRGSVSPNVYVDDLHMGQVTREEAKDRLQEHFKNILDAGALVIKFEDNSLYKIKYSEIDAVLDYDSTIDLFSSKNIGQSLKDLINDYFVGEKRVVSPVFSFNEGKLRQKLSEISSVVNKNSLNANIYIKDGEVIKTSDMQGIKLNIDNAVKKVKRDIGNQIAKPMEFKVSNSFELESVSPGVTLRDLEGADEIISRYSTDIRNASRLDSIKLAAAAINRVLVYPEDTRNGNEAGQFSFNKYLSAGSHIMEKNNEGYNQVASTLYAAALLSGIKPDAITRTPHKTPVEYIELGLDATVFGNSVDFRFKNTLGHTLIIFADVKDDKLTVSLVGKRSDSSSNNSLKVVVDQKFDPPVINVESHDLKPGEIKVISPGKEGVRVKVYMVTAVNHVELNRKLMYFDKYDAVESIVQIGPNTKWSNPIIK